MACFRTKKGRTVSKQRIDARKRKMVINKNKCKCGCGKLTQRTWVVGHYAKINPNPNNLGSYIHGKKGAEHPNWKGGIIIVSNYKYIYHPFHPFATKDGYVLEHRLIMESHIKRYLKKDEVVHHGNGNTLDNRFGNLALQKNQAEHNRNCHNHERDELGRFISGGATP